MIGKLKKVIYEDNKTYFTSLFYVGAVWGFIKGVLTVIDAFIQAIKYESALGVLVTIVFGQWIAALQALVSGFLTALVWGIVLFIPYKIIQWVYRAFRPTEPIKKE